MKPEQMHLRRQRRLFIWFAIARGLIFWYAIEKLFEISIGLSAQQIVIIGVIAQGSKLLLEIPSSAIADRWSRRNILIAAATTMLVSSTILGLSNSMTVYLIGILFWSLSDALSSGVYEAFVYDSFAGNGNKKFLSKLYARMFTVFIVTLGVSALVAGVAAEYASLRVGFFATIIPMLVCIGILLRLPEPDIKRTSDSGITWLRHIGSAGKLLWLPSIRWPIVLYVALFGLTIIWYEFYQLIGVELKMTPFLFSLIMVVMTLGMAVGAELSHRIKIGTTSVGSMWLILTLTSILGLRTAEYALAFINLFVLFVVIRMMQIYLELYINSQLDAGRRATALSLASTLAYGWFFGLALVYSQALSQWGARWAFTIASLPLIALIVVDALRGLKWARRALAAQPISLPPLDTESK
jgi:MFS family permease